MKGLRPYCRPSSLMVPHPGHVANFCAQTDPALEFMNSLLRNYIDSSGALGPGQVPTLDASRTFRRSGQWQLKPSEPSQDITPARISDGPLLQRVGIRRPVERRQEPQ